MHESGLAPFIKRRGAEGVSEEGIEVARGMIASKVHGRGFESEISIAGE